MPGPRLPHDLIGSNCSVATLKECLNRNMQVRGLFWSPHALWTTFRLANVMRAEIKYENVQLTRILGMLHLQ